MSKGFEFSIDADNARFDILITEQDLSEIQAEEGREFANAFCQQILQQILNSSGLEHCAGDLWSVYNFELSDKNAPGILNAAKEAEKMARSEGVDYKEALNACLFEFFEEVFGEHAVSFYHSNEYHRLFGDLGEKLLVHLADYPDIQRRMIGVDDTCINDVFAGPLTVAIADKDNSKPLEIIPGNLYGEWIHTPQYDFDKDYIDDNWIEHDGVCSGSDSVIFDEKFVRFLRLMQVSSKEIQEKLISLGASQETIEHWNDAPEPLLNPLKKQLADPELAITIMDNATYGGLPVAFCFINVKDFINRDIDQPFTVDNVQVGIQDFINGSGHMETAKGPLTVFPGEDWSSTDRFHIKVDDVYGFYIPAVKGEVSQVKYWPRTWLAKTSDPKLIDLQIKTATGDSWNLDDFEGISNPNADKPVGIIRHKLSNQHIFVNCSPAALKKLVEATKSPIEPVRFDDSANGKALERELVETGLITCTGSYTIPEDPDADIMDARLAEVGLHVPVAKEGNSYALTPDGYAYVAAYDEHLAQRLEKRVNNSMSPN